MLPKSSLVGLLVPAFCFAASFTAIHSAAASMRSRPDEFFKPGPEIPAALSDEFLYPRGSRFPLSFFSVGGGTEQKVNDLLPEEEVQKEFAHYKTLKIPVFGPQYELNERSLADAEKHDLQVVYTVGLPMNFHDRSGEGKGTLELSPEEITQQVSEQVSELAKNKRVALWYLRPEELRPWRKKEMAYLKAASEAVRASDPLKRPLWIYDPAHATAKRLAAIAPWVDYIGKGMYPNYASKKDSRIWCRWSMEQEVEAIRLAGSSAIPIAVAEMFRQPTDEDLPKIPAWVRHDVYLSLVSGAKGVMVFSTRRRPNFPARQAYYDAYAKVAGELLGSSDLGKLFLFGEVRKDVVVDVTDGPEELELLYPSGGVKEPLRYPSISFADLALGKDRYLVLVNSADAPVETSVGGMPYNAVRVESVLDASAPFDVGEGEFELHFEPYEVKILLLKRR